MRRASLALIIALAACGPKPAPAPSSPSEPPASPSQDACEPQCMHECIDQGIYVDDQTEEEATAVCEPICGCPGWSEAP